MERLFLCFLLLLSSSALCKYVYVQQMKTWHEAQLHCRLLHTDLAPVSDADDMERLLWRHGGTFWIGLQRDGGTWTWSGGGAVSTFFWALGQPSNGLNEDYGLVHHYWWHDAVPSYTLPFCCYRAVVVREEKTWQEALLHCRERHHDLASVASHTEMLLIQTELDKGDTTAHVWVGLRFLAGSWLWVDGRPLRYEAWGPEGGEACPKEGCAAMQGSNGTNTTARSGHVLSGVEGNKWEAQDCEDRKHFICY